MLVRGLTLPVQQNVNVKVDLAEAIVSCLSVIENNNNLASSPT